MRAEIAALPKGTWSFTDYIDGLGDEPEPIALKVAVTIEGERHDGRLDRVGAAGARRDQLPARRSSNPPCTSW